MTKQERLLLFILACINFTHIIDFMIMMPLGPQLMHIFKISPQEFGFLVSSYSLSAGVSGFLAAFFVDNLDRKQVILFAYTGFVIGTLGCAFAPSFSFLILARIVAGIFGGMIGSQVLSVVGDTFEYERRAKAMGIIMTAFSLASVVGIPAGLWLATKFSWHTPFLVIGCLGGLILCLIVFFVPKLDKHLAQHERKKNPFSVITDILQTPNQVRALALSVVIMLGHFSIIPYISTTLVTNIGFSQENLYLIYLVGGALTIFSAPLVGQIADKQGKLPVFVTFALLSMLPIFLITHLYPVPLYVVLIISGMFFVFSNGRLIPTQAMVSGVVTPQHRGGFMSINSSVQLLAQALATNIGGMILTKAPDGKFIHYDLVGYYAMAMIFMSIFIARKVKAVS